MVKAGEQSGRLEDVLFRLSRYYTDQKTISDKLKNAVTYPAAMLALIIAVLIVMLTMVLPAFKGVYDKLTGSLAASSYRYIRLAYVFSWVALCVMVVLAVLLVLGLVLWNTEKRPLVEKLLQKIPATRDILWDMGMFRFTSALSTFLASGEMQDIAVQDSIRMTDCAPVEEKLQKCLNFMEEGHSFAQAAYEEELFEPVYGRMLLAGERSGNMENVLARLTELLESDCVNRVDRLVGIVDPLLSGVLMITMYSDKKTPLLIRILPVILLLLAVGMLTLFFLLPRKDISTESTAAIREAVERSARQCYAVEGIYPPNLQYLQDHYGLQVNTKDFYVRYEAFASNLPPQVIVKVK